MPDKPFKPVIQETRTLVLLAVISIVAYSFAYFSRKEFVSSTYEIKINAAMMMQESMNMIKDFRMEKGVFIDQENDPNETGLVGSQFSLITTDEGDLDAKLTTLDPNFAAAMVELLYQADLDSGDSIAVMLTGSMPGANMGMLIACNAMGIHPFIISSIGASQWGANDPDMSWLDMERILFNSGYISARSIAVMDEQLFRIFGSFLGAGSVASFRYARRIALLPVGIVAQAVGVASYPTLSKMFVEKKFDELKNIIRTQLSSLFLFNVVMVLILVINSEEIISIVYERGRFSSADVIRVSSIMKVVALGVVPWSINQIVNRSYYVQKRYWFPVGVGTIGTLGTTITLLLSSNASEINYSIIIISFLWAYAAFMLFSLKIEGESILDTALIYDIFLCLLLSGIIYTALINLNLDFGNIIYNLVVTSIIVIISFLVSISIIRMNYVEFKRRR